MLAKHFNREKHESKLFVTHSASICMNDCTDFGNHDNTEKNSQKRTTREQFLIRKYDNSLKKFCQELFLAYYKYE